MKVSRKTVWQMTPAGYELVSADIVDYDGPLALAKGGKAAPVPDPAAQVKAEQNANQYNVQSPNGNINYSTDPTGRTTQTTTLAPSEQKQLDMSNQIAETMLSGAQKKIPSFSDSTFDYNDQGSKAGQAAYQRQVDLLTPEFAKQDTNFEDRMANAGIPLGSEAYNDSLRQHENDKNFALTQAAQQAETEGTGLALSQRQQNYNELAAALGGQQLNPVGAFGQAAAPVDVAGAYAQQNQANIANAQASNSSKNGLLGAAGQLGGAAITKYSDERLKEDIEPVGELPTGEGVYTYSYKADPEHRRETGVLAQEVEKSQPDLVQKDARGYRKVNYTDLIARAMAA
jgi:hypothetical protein